MKKRSAILIVIILASIFFIHPGFPQQLTQNYSSDVIETDIPFFKEDDVVIRGVFNEYNYGFFAPKFIKFEDSTFTVVLSHAKELVADISNLQVSVNDMPVGGFYLTPENSDTYKATLNIPKQFLKLGYNVIKLSFLMKTSDSQYADVNSPINWAIIHKDSSLHFKYKVVEDPGIRFFNEIFVKINNITSEDTAFLLDADSGDDILTAASIMANLLGKSSEKPRNIKVFFKNDIPPEVLSKYNIILLATKDLAPKLSPSIEKYGQLGEKDAMIFLSKSPQAKDKYVFGIVSKDGKGIKDAALYLANGEIGISSEPFNIIDQKVLENVALRPRKEISEKVSLKSLGYPDTVTNGIFSTSAALSLKRPCNWILNAGSRLDLIIYFSELLIPSTSTVTVHVNGIPVVSKRFTGESGKPFLVNAFIPTNMLDYKDFYVTADFYLDMGQKESNRSYTEKAWVVIKNDSYFYLPHKFKAGKDFSDFPSLLMKDDELTPTTVFVPDKLSEDILSAALTISASVGFELQNEPAFLKIKKAASFDTAPKDENIVLLGWPSGFSFYKQLDEQFPVKFDERNDSFKTQREISYLFAKDNYAVMQIGRSPFDREKLVVLLAAKDNGYGMLNEIFSGPGVYKLSGNFICLYPPDNVITYKLTSAP